MWQDLKSLKVLPVIALFVTSSRMSSITTENLNLEKACLVNIGFNDSICQALVARNKSGYTADQEIEVQKFVASMVAYKSVIKGIFPFLLILFVGSWSDRHRIRKPFILMPIYGDFVMNLGCLICVFFFRQLPMEVAIFFEAVPVALTGTSLCFNLGILCNVCENSTLANRTLRIGLATMFTQTSKDIGITLSGILHRLLGFYGVYSLSMLSCLVAIVYGTIVIDDSAKYNKSTTTGKFLKDVFDYKHVLQTVSVLFVNKKKSTAHMLVLVMLISTLKKGTNGGENILYMFTRRKFSWNEVDFSIYNIYHFLVCFTGLYCSITIFVKWMKLEDVVIGMITMVCSVVGRIAYFFAPTAPYFYWATLAELLSDGVHMVRRSMLSKMVKVDEIGQVFSVTALFEAAGPLIFEPFYSFVYYKTLGTYPGMFFLLTAGIETTMFFIFLLLYTMRFCLPLERAENQEKGVEMRSISGNGEAAKMIQPTDVHQKVEDNNR